MTTPQTLKRCEITDLWPDQCACPRHRNVVPEDETRRVLEGRVYIAELPGTCRGCMVSPIRSGDQVIPYKGAWLLLSCECNEVA